MKVFPFSKQAVQYTCNKNRHGALSIADTEKYIWRKDKAMLSVFFIFQNIHLHEHCMYMYIRMLVHLMYIGKKSEV
jgi:hypothetical protein